ncbi:hypothetical protein DRJ25_00405 [Candidatus Woesearchaeota archaeon]|nr:MAG: hypothetical protein DRJ25_00405 [Candidatus Woesearchaeota archaeon]
MLPEESKENNDDAEVRRIRGIECEKEFKKWLDKNNIPYMYIQQDTDTFSYTLKKYFLGKRPDFMVLLPSLGFIFVDVKYKKLNEKFNSFPLDAEETKKYSSLQRRFNLHTWYVLSNEKYGYKTWFWIPVSRVLEEGSPKFLSRKSKMDFFAVQLDKFIQVSSNDSLDRLFSKILF